MGAFTSLKQLFARPRPPLAPMDDPFIQMDRALSAERLRLIERGAENGAAELPAADASVPDAVEAEIIAGINEHYSRAQIDAANQTRTYEERLADLTLLAELSSIKAAAKVATGDFNAEVSVSNNMLANRRDAIRDSYADLREFRTRHRLSRPAQRAQPKAAMLGGILAGWLIETTANTAFLKVNDEMGLVGGAIAAAIVAAVNVFISAVVGRLVWPRAQSVDPVTRYSFRAGIIAWLVLLGIWSVAAAHYRDAKAAGAAVPEVEALRLFQTHPFTFDSLYSWGLLVVGIVFAVLSALAAFRIDDPYPGYGAVSRAHNDRCREYALEVADATDRLRDIRERAIGEAEEVRAQLSTEFRERDRIIVAANAFRRRYEEFSGQLEQTANALLEVYRGSNRRARSTPPPPHFNAYWTLARTPIPPIAGASTPEVEIKAAERELDTAVTTISDAFDLAIRSFEPLDALKQRLADA